MELISRVRNVTLNIRTQNLFQQRLFNRVQRDETEKNFVYDINYLGKVAYPNETQHHARNEIQYQILVRGLKNRKLANKMMQENGTICIVPILPYG